MAHSFNHEGYDLSGYDQDLVKQAQGGQSWGENDQARYDKLVSAKQKAQAQSQKGGATGKPENAIDQTQTGKADVVPSNQNISEFESNMPRSASGQNVNQNNDINTNVKGDKNTVITEQDNSVRNYGGNSRSFTYNGGKGGLTGGDSPVSMATMAGFYDVDDSPAAQAKFVDMYSTMNRDNQKRYAGDAMKTYAKYGNIDARSYTDESMENAPSTVAFSIPLTVLTVKPDTSLATSGTITTSLKNGRCRLLLLQLNLMLKILLRKLRKISKISD